MTVPAAALALAFALVAIPLSIAGVDPLPAYRLMVAGAFGSRLAATETLVRAAPLILTGLAVAVAFRARLWNIGAEGQLYAGALAAVAVGSGALSVPSWSLVPLVLTAAACAGALLMLAPTWLKLAFGVDEVVTTLLLNFVTLLFVSMMLDGPMKDPMGMGWPQSAPMDDAAMLPRLVERSRLHAGLLIGIAAAVAAWFVIHRSVHGLELRATGLGEAAARYAGIPVRAVILCVGLLSGALAGLAGAGEVAGLKGYLTQDLSPGYGYAGITVAMLAGLEPLIVPLAALFVAAVFVGADSMGRATGVSSYIADLMVATSLLTMLLAGLVGRFRIRRG